VADRGDANLAALAQRMLDNLRITAEMLVGAWEGMIQQEEARQAAQTDAQRKAETTILPIPLAGALQPAKLPEFPSVAAHGTQTTSSVQSGDVQAYIAAKALLRTRTSHAAMCIVALVICLIAQSNLGYWYLSIPIFPGMLFALAVYGYPVFRSCLYCCRQATLCLYCSF
jgi:hypothetical protein